MFLFGLFDVCTFLLCPSLVVSVLLYWTYIYTCTRIKQTKYEFIQHMSVCIHVFFLEAISWLKFEKYFTWVIIYQPGITKFISWCSCNHKISYIKLVERKFLSEIVGECSDNKNALCLIISFMQSSTCHPNILFIFLESAILT